MSEKDYSVFGHSFFALFGEIPCYPNTPLFCPFWEGAEVEMEETRFFTV